MAAIRMIAKVPTLAASRTATTWASYVYPDNDLSYPGNFLSMMFKKTEATYEPDPRLERALTLFILHADHEQNCSPTRCAASALAGGPLFAVAAGRCAVRPASRRRQRVRARAAAADRNGRERPRLPGGGQEPRERLMGFGTACTRTTTRVPGSSSILRRGVRGHRAQPAGRDRPRAREARPDDDYFTSRKLYPNVDYYSGIIYGTQIPTEMFTVIFAIPRTSGWVSQWMELNDDPGEDRPRQVYINGIATTSRSIGATAPRRSSARRLAARSASVAARNSTREGPLVAPR